MSTPTLDVRRRPSAGRAGVDEHERWRGVALDSGPVDATGRQVPAAAQPAPARRRCCGPYKGWIAVMVARRPGRERGPAVHPAARRPRHRRGLPPVMAGGSPRTLLEIVAAMLVAVVLQSLGPDRRSCASRAASARTCCSSCAAASSAHFQKLDVAFHDRFTSGRVTSRLTSDIDAITELLVGGFDGLVTAVLTMVGVAVLMISLDVEARAGLPDLLPGPAAARALVRAPLGARLPPRPRAVGPGHRAVRRDDDRHPRGAGLPPRGAQLGDLRRDRRPLQGREHRLVPPGRGLHAGRPADRQRHHRRRRCSSAACGRSRATSPSAC